MVLAQDKLKAGIEAARRGDKLTAVRLLRQVTDREPNNEVAWMWLASALDNLGERRAALEQVLRINPSNARAQQALQQIAAVTPGARKPASAARTPAVPQAGNNPLLLIGGAVVALAVLATIIFNIIASQQPPPINALTRQAIEAAVFTSLTPPPTIDPDTYTPTPFFGVIVTPANLPTFPPTFTPTFTPTASSTPPPTATTIPLSAFGLLFTSQGFSDAQPALYQANGDGSAAQQIGGADPGFSDVAVAPNGQRIAFVRTVTYSRGEGESAETITAPELFVAPLNDLGAARQITQLGGSVLATPSWAPDSIQIVFVSDADGDLDLYYITEDGNNLRVLTDNTFIDKDPAWSPVADVILYASERANFAEGSANLALVGLTEIFTITPTGEIGAQLTNDQNSSYSPSWSPAGDRIVFASDRGGDSDIYVMDPNGQRQTRLTLDDGDAEDRRPQFAPNGKEVIFISNRETALFEFYTVDLDKRIVTRLPAAGLDIQSFVFRP